jgi:hypothetical protein
VLHPVLLVMFIPLILARLAGLLPQKAQTLLRQGKRYNFMVWLFNLLIISANASQFVRNEHSGLLLPLFQIALLALVICIVNFPRRIDCKTRLPAGIQPGARPEKHHLRYLDCADLYQSHGRHGANILHPVSQPLQFLANLSF